MVNGNNGDGIYGKRFGRSTKLPNNPIWQQQSIEDYCACSQIVELLTRFTKTITNNCALSIREKMSCGMCAQHDKGRCFRFFLLKNIDKRGRKWGKK